MTTLIATVFPLICWLVYGWGVRLIERQRPSLSVIMSIQRRRWVANAARRESPLDAILSGNLMQSVSFLASTSVLLILAVFTGFGQLEGLQSSLAAVSLSERPYSVAEMQIHLVVMLAIFVLAFFAFTLALRQFNHFCIMLGAIDHQSMASEDEIDAIAQLNSLAARNFNNGLRAFYFAVASVAWFAADWLAILVSVGTVAFLIHREFFSTAHRIAASATVVAAKRSAQAVHE
jgi:uncharacterized membrane protein